MSPKVPSYEEQKRCRYRNFEALHRRLKELPQYKLKLPPKRYLGPNLDGSFVLERRAHLDKYLQDLLAVPSVAESHEVWDFLSANSQVSWAFEPETTSQVRFA